MEALQDFLGHYHGFFVHFPIALIVVGALLQFIWVFKPSDALRHAAMANLCIGALGAIPAVLSGLSRIHHPEKLQGLILLHRNLGLITTTWAILQLLIFFIRPQLFKNKVFVVVWAFLGAALVLATGYFGAEVAEGS